MLDFCLLFYYNYKRKTQGDKMTESEKKVMATFRIEKNKWETFKKIAKARESDANKELRKFVNEFIEQNRDLVNKLF